MSEIPHHAFSVKPIVDQLKDSIGQDSPNISSFELLHALAMLPTTQESEASEMPDSVPGLAAMGGLSQAWAEYIAARPGNAQYSAEQRESMAWWSLDTMARLADLLRDYDWDMTAAVRQLDAERRNNRIPTIGASQLLFRRVQRS